ncbi:MAG TPA: GntR family transcriptional regulator [Candidatus Dormibacteraeota bacterium]|nr:GntR family transcriptional regulator [Candidatus Dormibacteraeota bacterium]
MMQQSSHLPAAAPLSFIERSAAPLRRQVLDELRQSIIAGRLAPGSRLIERELIAMMGVSRTVIREALRQMESEGLVANIPNKGPVVRELTLAEAKDLYSIRAVLEGLAARLFTENASPAQKKLLEQALKTTAQSYENGDPTTILEAKNRFYDVLFQGAGSETLSSMIGTLHVRIWRWRALGLGHPRRSEKRWKESIRRLRAMLAAIFKGDASLAETLLRDEVTKAAAEVMRLLINKTPVTDKH